MSTTLTKPEPHAARIWIHSAWPARNSNAVVATGRRADRATLFKGRMLPSLDLSETPNTIEVRMDVPGIKAEEIDIQLANGVLTISGERRKRRKRRAKCFIASNGAMAAFHDR